MTEEDCFQAKLDENPADHYTRLVFADWLQDRDDPRAGGYRAMAHVNFVPYQLGNYTGGTLCEWSCGNYANPSDVKNDRSTLPYAWWSAVKPLHVESTDRRQWIIGEGNDEGREFATWVSRVEMEDVVALAFSRLNESEKTAILAGVVVECAVA